MGGKNSKIKQIGTRPINTVILGFDNAGKTTTVKVLEKTSIDSVSPTIGYCPHEIIHSNEKIKLIDLGGEKSFREAWRHYFHDAYGFIYTIDSSEKDRLDENREELQKLLQEEKVKNKPMLILANKQDEPEALDKNAILESLKIERLVNDNKTLCRVELCTAKLTSPDGKSSKIDQSIQNGFDWIVKTIYENYDVLHKRVEHDVQKRNAAEQIEKAERRKVVEKIRAEREKQEGKENDEEEDSTTNGFVPIGQAVKNAQTKSAVITNTN